MLQLEVATGPEFRIDIVTLRVDFLRMRDACGIISTTSWSRHDNQAYAIIRSYPLQYMVHPYRDLSTSITNLGI